MNQLMSTKNIHTVGPLHNLTSSLLIKIYIYYILFSYLLFQIEINSSLPQGKLQKYQLRYASYSSVLGNEHLPNHQALRGNQKV